MDWVKAFDSELAKEYFAVPLRHWEHQWTRYLTEEGVWNHVRSTSFINRLSPEEKEVSFAKYT
jgi:hypothetical protein